MQYIVITLIGNDRSGLVRALATAVAQCEGNWVDSRLARLGGKFAGVVRIAIPPHQATSLSLALQNLQSEGLTITTTPDEIPNTSPHHAGTLHPITLHLTGNDKPGIVRQVAQALAEAGVNVEEFTSEVIDAPWSGSAVFQATARLSLPTHITAASLRQALESLSADLMVDIAIQETKTPNQTT